MTEAQYIDTDEREAIEALEAGGWNPVKNLDSWKTRLSTAAAATLTKDQRMNIRLTRNDFDGIKQKAVEEGLPYQTLVASIIHKYLTGRLVERHT
jgi:predicted DNA binding CopG/RHH family protein